MEFYCYFEKTDLAKTRPATLFSPALLLPYRSACAIKQIIHEINDLKWWAIQLAIHCTIDTLNNFRLKDKCIQIVLLTLYSLDIIFIGLNISKSYFKVFITTCVRPLFINLVTLIFIVVVLHSQAWTIGLTSSAYNLEWVSSAWGGLDLLNWKLKGSYIVLHTSH